MHDKLEPQKPQGKSIAACNAVNFLENLHLLGASTNLQAGLESFSSPKPLTQTTFIEGVKKFVELTNISTDKREIYFGNKFGGLHYGSDLLQLWLHENNLPVTETTISLSTLAPLEWKIYNNGSNFSYSYEGDNPAEALSHFLQGPSIIDCGMYCQLGILFGLRFVFGDKAFNDLFSAKPLLMSQNLSKTLNTEPWLNNPFQAFLSECDSLDDSQLGLTYIPNNPAYLLKHPAGCYAGINCLVMDKSYFGFEASLSSSGAEKHEIVEQLRLAFNKDPDFVDENRLKSYKHYGTRLHPGLQVPYSDLIYIAKQLSSKSFDKSEHKRLIDELEPQAYYYFDFNKFILAAKELIRDTHSLAGSNTCQAINELSKIQALEPALDLKVALDKYRNPKELTLEVFTQGVEEFIQLANLSYERRAAFFGHQLSGLHYASDLATAWNSIHASNPIKSIDLPFLAPNDWECYFEFERVAYKYQGTQPAHALDKLLQGPTVIDCGMFCQLSLFFGIRYLLGDEEFNQLFSQAPLYITQSMYNVREDENPYCMNHLYPFFGIDEAYVGDSVCITNVPNNPLYLFKHPGGDYCSQNCVVINGQYAVFDPTAIKTKELTRDDVIEALRVNFNEAQDVHDKNKLAFYQQSPDAIDFNSKKTYGDLIDLAKEYANFTCDKESHKRFYELNPARHVLRFHLRKLKTWIQGIKRNESITPKLSDLPLALAGSPLHANQHEEKHLQQPPKSVGIRIFIESESMYQVEVDSRGLDDNRAQKLQDVLMGQRGLKSCFCKSDKLIEQERDVFILSYRCERAINRLIEEIYQQLYVQPVESNLQVRL